MKRDYHKLIFLKKENDINKVLKKQKKTKSTIKLLFTSLWDRLSRNLIDDLKITHGWCKEGVPTYIIDSYHMPHSFVIFGTTKCPQLVSISDKGVLVEDYLPRIYTELDI